MISRALSLPSKCAVHRKRIAQRLDPFGGLSNLVRHDLEDASREARVVDVAILSDLSSVQLGRLAEAHVISVAQLLVALAHEFEGVFFGRAAAWAARHA